LGEARRRATIAQQELALAKAGVVAILLFNESLPFALDEPLNLAPGIDPGGEREAFERERTTLEYERELVQDWPPFNPVPTFSDSAVEALARMWEGITNSSCRFPLGDPKSREFKFCGAPASKPPYCPECAERAFVKRAGRPRAPMVRPRISGVRLRCIA
jgi:hypothetical protein